MKLIIVRHADPDYQIDSLTPHGFYEAKSVAKRLAMINVKSVYVSPLGRAQKTAEEYFKLSGKSGKTLDFLREFNYSVEDDSFGKLNQPWDFMPAYFAKNKNLLTADWIKQDFIVKAGIDKKYEYVAQGIDEVLYKHGYVHEDGVLKAVAPNDDSVLMFCHFGVECMILSHLFGVSPMIFSQNFCVLPSGVTLLVTEERQQGIASLRCLYMGDISHLAVDGIEPSFAGRFCERFTDDTRH